MSKEVVRLNGKMNKNNVYNNCLLSVKQIIAKNTFFHMYKITFLYMNNN